MNKTLLSIAVLVMALFTSCGEEHFISDSDFMKQVRDDLAAKQQQLPNGDFFSILSQEGLTTYEKEALEFLYAYMPESDIVDQTGDFFLENVRLTRQAVSEMPWGKQLDESLIRYFVLPLRVNNEPLDGARKVFYDMLKDRVKDKTMLDAIIEVNHWCHEKVVYTPSDGRTSSPLQSLRTAFGRCGEESTFCVAAMRSVGIPARQVYTPRWAHTDDNHAWVEVWVDGKWHFLGACEPEPVLDLGWFNAPASRGMLMHTKVFGNYNGAEEVMVRKQNFTEINVIDNYAKSARMDVTVVDEAGKPVADATVEFKVYNYGEFYTVAKKQTDAEGKTFLTSGLGNLFVWVSKDDKFGYERLSFGKETEKTIALCHKPGEAIDVDIDMVPPPVHFDKPEVTAEQRAHNDTLCAREDSIRNAYVATMMNHDKAVAWAAEQGFDTAVVAPLLVKSRGNHAAITDFLTAAEDKQLAVTLLASLSSKDLRDVPQDVIESHLTTSIRQTEVDDKEFNELVLCPRVELEQLTAYKPFFQQNIDEATAAAYRANPAQFVEWVKANITLDKEVNLASIPVSPIGVWKARVADERSRAIFFVSVCRSLGIPAGLNPVNGKVQYTLNHEVCDVDFEAAEQTAVEKGVLSIDYDATPDLKNPRYYTHFTLSKYENGALKLLDFESGDTDLGDGADWASMSKNIKLEKGYYLLCSGTRQPDGSVLSHLTWFNIGDEPSSVRLVMRESVAGKQVIGNIDTSLAFQPLTLENNAIQQKEEAQQALKDGTTGYFIAVVLGVNEEPTNHVLRDIAALKDDFQQWGQPVYMFFPNADKLAKFRLQDFPGLPSTIQFGMDKDICLQKAMAEGGQLGDPDQLPIVVLAHTDGRVFFASQGYTIGMGEQLMKVVHNLNKCACK
ncbi:MAG: transglutaminase domain-containing protein [Bacteroidaceae bacterium]|nr:transglutaminase domain-containing protein [Bacteroidaceae bacterium]